MAGGRPAPSDLYDQIALLDDNLDDYARTLNVPASAGPLQAANDPQPLRWSSGPALAVARSQPRWRSSLRFNPPAMGCRCGLSNRAPTRAWKWRF